MVEARVVRGVPVGEGSMLLAGGGEAGVGDVVARGGGM